MWTQRIVRSAWTDRTVSQRKQFAEAHRGRHVDQALLLKLESEVVALRRFRPINNRVRAGDARSLPVRRICSAVIAVATAVTATSACLNSLASAALGSAVCIVCADGVAPCAWCAISSHTVDQRATV